MVAMGQTRREFLTGLGAVLLLPLLTGCTERPPLRIAAHPWPGYELLFLARRQGWLNEQQARLVETGSASASLQAVASGSADGACLTLDELLRARDGGLSLTAVLVFNISAGADQVLGRPGITSISQLTGKRIGVEQSAVGELMLLLTLQAAGLERSQVTVVPLTPDRHLEVWRTGQLDAIVCYEPIASHLHDIGATSLYDSRSMPGMIVDVLAVRTELLDRQAAALRALTAEHFRALDYLRRHPQDAAYRMSERFKLPAGEVLDTYRGLELPGQDANRKLLAGPSARLLGTARTLSPILQQVGLLKQPANLAGLVDDRFLAERDS